MRHSLRWMPLAAVAAFVMTACSDGGTGPAGTDFDPQATDQATQNLQASLNNDSDMMVSLGLAGEGLAAAGGVSMIVPRRLDGPATPFSAQVVRDMTLSGSLMEPIFPSNLLGATFEWSFDLDRYAPTERAGAPANGVRFVLYAINPLTRRPAEPLSEVGFLDLTDEGDASSTRLGIHAESGGAALVDYFIDVSYALLGDQDIRVTVTADGYISDGQEQLDFLLTESATLLGSTETILLDVSYELSLAGESVSVRLDVSGEFDFSGDTPVDAATAQLSIHDGPDHVVFDMTLQADNTLSGVIDYNGAPAMYISGTEADPVFTRADGEPLTAEDVAALLALYDLLEDVFDVTENLFSPFGGGF